MWTPKWPVVCRFKNQHSKATTSQRLANMPPKKNTVKMDLNAFLADDTYGSAADSWADDFDPSMLNPSSTVDLGINLLPKEPEIPDRPPYTARIASFPDGTPAEDIRNFFVDGLKLSNPDAVIEDFYCPKDFEGNMKHFAFITFTTRELLVDALALNQHPLDGKPVTVGVAHPPKNDRAPRGQRSYDDNLDWGSARGSAQQRDFDSRGFRPPRERREPMDENLDWGAARGTVQQKEFDSREFRGPPRERRPPMDENLDWGAGRGSAIQKEFEPRQFRERGPPRERREPAQDDFDWGAGRGSAVQKDFEPRQFRERGPPRERKAPAQDDFDWGAARGSAVQKEFEPRQYRERGPPKEKKAAPADNLEWGARGSMLKAKQAKQAAKPAQTKPAEQKKAAFDGPKQSMYSVLATEDDEEEEEEQEAKEETTEDKTVDEVTASTSKLTVEGDGWTPVN